MNQGFYHFYNTFTRLYLSCNERQVTLSRIPALWNLQDSGQNGFYVYANESNLLLDIDNALVRQGTTVKLWEETGYDVQIWTVFPNPNGTVSFLYSRDHRFCLGFSGKNAVLQMRDPRDPMQEWQASAANYKENVFRLSSRGGVVSLALPADIESVISSERLKLWANHLERAYQSYGELTGFLPFTGVTVRSEKILPDPSYAGWAYPKSNVIHIAEKYVYKDLEQMTRRRCDWNFCALHEMSHLFDFYMPWSFEGELMADLKLAYVLEKNGAAAALGNSYDPDCYYGADIAIAYGAMSRDFSQSYDIFGCTKRFLDFQKEVGWEPFRRSFHHLYANRSQYENISQKEKFYLFIQTLSDFSGKNAANIFSLQEWNAILNSL